MTNLIVKYRQGTSYDYIVKRQNEIPKILSAFPINKRRFSIRLMENDINGVVESLKVVPEVIKILNVLFLRKKN